MPKGKEYSISSIEVDAFEMVFTEDEMRRLISITMGDLYKRHMRTGINDTEDSIKRKLQVFREQHRL